MIDERTAPATAAAGPQAATKPPDGQSPALPRFAYHPAAGAAGKGPGMTQNVMLSFR